MMTVQDLMSDRVITIDIDTPFTEACRMFPSIHIHHLPVLDSSGYLVGMFSTTDALYALNNLVHKKIRDEDHVNQLIDIESIMTSGKIYTLSSSSDLNDAITLLQDVNINSIPVVDDGILVGILTTHDLLKALQDDKALTSVH